MDAWEDDWLELELESVEADVEAWSPGLKVF